MEDGMLLMPVFVLLFQF